ncbi:MAG: type I 3-dehydroquinate dehydratase [Anaerolineae bacterium]|nr:type I 3-dehydroquinate dehydratase [Anaerolineae bacterium]
MTYLAISLAAPDTDAALAAMRDAVRTADLVELRLDLMQRFDLAYLLAGRPLPAIVTCRPAREGGGWQGSEADRLALLAQAAALGADYVDLEWDCADYVRRLDRSRTRVILSRHDLVGTPPDLAALVQDLWSAGPDVVKVAVTAQRLADAVPVLQVLAEATGPTIAISMGPHGLVTRLLAFRYGHALLSFAAPTPSGKRGKALCATAPGQLPAAAMRSVYRVHHLSPRTGLVGLVSPRANTSAALRLANAWLAKRNADVVVLPLQPARNEDVAAALAALAAAAPWRGFLLEPPYDRGRRGLWPGNTVRLADGVAQAATLEGLAERLSWIVAQDTSHG